MHRPEEDGVVSPLRNGTGRAILLEATHGSSFFMRLSVIVACRYRASPGVAVTERPGGRPSGVD